MRKENSLSNTKYLYGSMTCRSIKSVQLNLTCPDFKFSILFKKKKLKQVLDLLYSQENDSRNSSLSIKRSKIPNVDKC